MIGMLNDGDLDQPDHAKLVRDNCDIVGDATPISTATTLIGSSHANGVTSRFDEHGNHTQ